MKAQGNPPNLNERRRGGPGLGIAPAIVPCKGTTGYDRDLVIPFQGMIFCQPQPRAALAFARGASAAYPGFLNPKIVKKFCLLLLVNEDVVVGARVMSRTPVADLPVRLPREGHRE